LERFGTSSMATMQSWTGFEPHHYFHITTTARSTALFRLLGRSFD